MKNTMFFCKGKKVPYGSFYKDEWFLDSSTSVYFILFITNKLLTGCDT